MILHLGKFYYPARGGIETVTRDLAKMMVDAGEDVFCIAFDSTIKKILVENVENVCVIRCPILCTIASQPISFSYILKSVLYLRRARIVHAHWPNLLIFFVFIFKFLTKAKFVLHWHADHSKLRVVRIMTEPFVRFIVHCSDIVVFTSMNYAVKSSHYKNCVNKFEVIPIFCSETSGLSHTKDYQFRKKYNLLTVGRLVQYKNYEGYLLALASLRDKRPHIFSKIECISIVGDGPLKKYLSNLITELGLNKLVKLFSNVDDKMLSALYRAADCFVLPSNNKAEAFGVVLLEAKKHGLPCIAVNIEGSGVSWVADTKRAAGRLIAINGTCDAIEEVLSNFLILDGSDISALGKDALNDVNCRFGLHSGKRAWLSIYQ